MRLCNINFLQLSSTRQLTLCNNILETFSMKSNMANFTGAVITVLYNDPTMEYLSHKHILLLFVSLVLCLLLVIIPSFLLCIYPTRVYPLISCYISTWKQLAITFVKSLNHIYKDDLSDTGDYRWLDGFEMLSVTFVSVFFKGLIVFMPNYNWFLLCCHFFSIIHKTL